MLAGFAAGARRTARLVLPPTCLSCNVPLAEDHALCGSCWARTPFLSPPWCMRLGRPFSFDLGEGALSPQAIASPPVFDRARAACAFSGPARDLVHGLKYADRAALARAMGRWMARAGAELLKDKPLVMPVPLHRTRLWQRRFNQAALLAREVARMSDVPLRLDALERVRATSRQVGLSARARAQNVRRAFRVSPDAAGLVAGRPVVIVDDVFTTGATVSACARVLKRSGATRVDVLTFALADADIPAG
ncbi:ComF family protein [Stappia sp. F7233]|uniref:ComF family protein n=1 Tax=Stappia albiluteola TaxID=2758565 RepID=A0A839AIG2_9HYPH|nr:ComF family protein [Stappia albiluteola]